MWGWPELATLTAGLLIIMYFLLLIVVGDNLTITDLSNSTHTVSRLLLTGITMAGAGTYKCQALNSLLEDSSSDTIHITVIGKPHVE